MHIYGRDRGSVSALLAPLEGVEVGVRWGGPPHPGAINGEVQLLSGLAQLEAMQGAGVRVPQFTPAIEVAHAMCAEGKTVLGRSLHHTQGRDIVLPGRREWAQRDYWVVYLQDVESEWRLHVLHGKCIARGQKVFVPTPQRPLPRTLTENGGVRADGVIVRSRRLGWRIDHSVAPPDRLRTLACKAVQACKYDLGAVDCAVLSDGTQVVFEVNSRPAIRDAHTIGQYTKYLQRWATTPWRGVRGV